MWIKCSQCGAINTEFNTICHCCGKEMATGDRIITTDNTSEIKGE